MSSPLLQIPTEIRLKILRFLLVCCSSAIECVEFDIICIETPKGSDTDQPSEIKFCDKPKPVGQILRVNKQLLSEGTPLLYGENVFKLCGLQWLRGVSYKSFETSLLRKISLNLPCAACKWPLINGDFDLSFIRGETGACNLETLSMADGPHLPNDSGKYDISQVSVNTILHECLKELRGCSVDPTFLFNSSNFVHLCKALSLTFPYVYWTKHYGRVETTCSSLEEADETAFGRIWKCAHFSKKPITKAMFFQMTENYSKELWYEENVRFSPIHPCFLQVI